LDTNLIKDSSLLLHAVHSPFYWRILRKPYSSLVLKLLTKKIRETRKLEYFHEKHFVKRKNEDRKPDKNSSLRRLELMLTSTKNPVQEFQLWPPLVLQPPWQPRNILALPLCHLFTCQILDPPPGLLWYTC
jgi:hypothetical protein